VAADDLVRGVPEEVSDLGVGEGEVAVAVEDVDEVGGALHQGAVPGLGQSQILDRVLPLQGGEAGAQLLDLS